jgi:hypothetical protein
MRSALTSGTRFRGVRRELLPERGFDASLWVHGTGAGTILRFPI